MTKIEWTDKTVNPIHFLSIVDGKKQNGGHICIKRSPACMNCYAEDANLNGYKFWASRLEYHANEIIETLPDFLKLGNQKATVFINSRLFFVCLLKINL